MRGLLSALLIVCALSAVPLPVLAQDQPDNSTFANPAGPRGWQVMCSWAERIEEFCTASPLAQIELSDANWQLIAETNLGINHAYRQMTDEVIYGLNEVWTLPVTGADCEDYALAKLRSLVAAGVPRGALSLVVGRRDSEGHTVLAVRTSRGLIVLDNLDDAPYAPGDSTFHPMAIQAAGEPMRWEAFPPQLQAEAVPELTPQLASLGGD